MYPLASLRPPTQPGQIGLGTGFIQKNQPGRVERRLLAAPVPARPENVGPVLFAGPERLFLYVSPIFSST
jgi:hypothetical protein